MAGLRAPRTPQQKQPDRGLAGQSKRFKLPLLTPGGEAGGIPEPQTAAGARAEGPGGTHHQAGGRGSHADPPDTQVLTGGEGTPHDAGMEHIRHEGKYNVNAVRQKALQYRNVSSLQLK